MSTNFFDSVFKYTDPVRYFKANDPYYYEVDNIPLKQLQENCNFLKDQINKLLVNGPVSSTGGGGGGTTTTIGSIGRDGFIELQPYAVGVDNKVKVKPGKYTARINDAYTIQPLQFIQQIGGFSPGDIKTFQYSLQADQIYNTAVQKIKSYTASDALGMNGLLDRTFVYWVKDTARKSIYLVNSGCPQYTDPGSDEYFGFPNNIGFLFETLTRNTLSSTPISTFSQALAGTQEGFKNLVKLENLFIKRWRGITRTAIVNVDEELEIEIPPFDDQVDYFYYDENGVKQSLQADQRIDLLFIYSKPIDATGTTINKFSPTNGLGFCGPGSQPVKISKPILGLVRGAGLGVSYQFGSILGAVYQPEGNSTVQLRSGIRKNDFGVPGNLSFKDEHTRILPSVADLSGANIGFGNIKGSFPSPDDLMNIAPLLTEDIEKNNWALIGQSVLPIAYIVVKKSANTSLNANNIIQPEDVIDIRPFFRTTELAYNERAGLAAATPQVSLANPVATEGYVDWSVRSLSERIRVLESGAGTTGTGGSTTTTTTVTSPKIIGAGYIKGGISYGVEGTLLSLLKNTNQNATRADVTLNFNYPTNNIELNPDWDLAAWTSDPDLVGPAAGTTKFDWINYSVQRAGAPYGTIGNTFLNNNAVAYGPDGLQLNLSQSNPQNKTGFASFPASRADSKGGWYTFYYVSKTIRLNTSQLPWLSDFRVNARLHNCVPLSSKGNGSFTDSAGLSDIWVSKKRINPGVFEFTIFVGWAANDLLTDITSPFNLPDTTRFLFPKIARTSDFINSESSNYTGFAVITKDMLEQRDTRDIYPSFNGRPDTNANNYNPSYYSSGGNKIGSALYPTVSFEVIGIPSNYNPGQSLAGTNPYLQIVP